MRCKVAEKGIIVWQPAGAGLWEFPFPEWVSSQSFMNPAFIESWITLVLCVSWGAPLVSLLLKKARQRRQRADTQGCLWSQMAVASDRPGPGQVSYSMIAPLFVLGSRAVAALG